MEGAGGKEVDKAHITYEIIHSKFNVLKKSAEMRMKMHFLMQKELRFLKIKL